MKIHNYKPKGSLQRDRLKIVPFWVRLILLLTPLVLVIGLVLGVVQV